MGKSFLAVKRLEYRTKDRAVKSGTTFKCIACTMQQVYRHIHTFESFEVPGLLMYKGSSIVHTSVNESRIFLDLESWQRRRWWGSMRSSFKATADNTSVQYFSHEAPTPDNPVFSPQLGRRFTNAIVLNPDMSVTYYECGWIQQHRMLCCEWKVSITEPASTSPNSELIMKEAKLLLLSLELWVTLK